jgi:hypothetical protein
MNLKCCAAVAALVISASLFPARAQTSTWEPRTSMTFQEYFEPFPLADDAEACREICLKNNRCSGWTYYHPDFVGTVKNWETLLRKCIVGAGLKDRNKAAPGRTSGEISRR